MAMMEVCADGHEEVCYLSGRCPLCRANDEHEDQRTLLNNQIEELKGEVSNLEAEIEDMEKRE